MNREKENSINSINKEGRSKGKRPLQRILRAAIVASLVGSLGLGYHKLEKSTAVADSPDGIVLTQDPPPDDGKQRVVDDTAWLGHYIDQAKKNGEQFTTKEIVSQDLESLEVKTLGNLTLTKLIGNWSEQQLNILILGDKFVDNNVFLTHSINLVNQIFSVGPFALNKDKFGAYALSINNVLPLGCFDPFVLCNDKLVKDAIERVTNAYRLHMQEVIVVEHNSIPKGRAAVDRSITEPTLDSYTVFTTGALFPEFYVAPHEFGHSFGNLGDEYGSGSFYPAAGSPFINCLPAEELAIRWLNIPGQPGTSFKGCNNTSDGYRDHLNDLMRNARSTEFGPVDKYQLKRFIDQGPGRYNLPPLPPEPAYRLFLPIIIRNK